MKENGAIIDKVQWPATSTVDGVRGAVATTDIDPLVPMFEIPTKLMMSPVQALQSKEVHSAYNDHIATHTMFISRVVIG